MVLLFFVILCIPNPILLIVLGMVFALLILIPPFRNWNQSYGRNIVTSVGLAFLAILAFHYLNAYGSAEMTLYKSRAVNAPFIDSLVNGYRDDVKKELSIRALHPRLDFQPCYSEQKNICEIADTVQIIANEGYAPLKDTLKGYWLTIGFTFLWIWT